MSTDPRATVAGRRSRGAVEVVLHRAPASGPASEETALRRVLTTEERAAADAHRTPSARGRAVRSRALLRGVLGARLGVAPAAVPVRRRACTACGGPHGKPEVAEPWGRAVRFAVAHAEDVVLVAVTGDGVELGLDLEGLERAGGLWEQEAGWLHPAERAALGAAPRSPALAARIWTRKEAVLKGTGEGLNREPSTLDVLGADDPVAGGPLVEGWRVLDLVPGAGLAGALAVDVDVGVCGSAEPCGVVVRETPAPGVGVPTGVGTPAGP